MNVVSMPLKERKAFMEDSGCSCAPKSDEKAT